MVRKKGGSTHLASFLYYLFTLRKAFPAFPRRQTIRNSGDQLSLYYSSHDVIFFFWIIEKKVLSNTTVMQTLFFRLNFFLAVFKWKKYFFMKYQRVCQVVERDQKSLGLTWNSVRSSRTAAQYWAAGVCEGRGRIVERGRTTGHMAWAFEYHEILCAT